MNSKSTIFNSIRYFACLSTAVVFTLLGSNRLWAQKVEKTAPAGKGIYEAVFNSQDGHLYVTGAGTKNQPGGALYKINPQNLAMLDSIELTENPPFGIGINTKTQVVYTSNTRSNSVSAIDLKTGKLIALIKEQGEEKAHTREVLVDEENNLVYVSVVGKPSKIWVIDGKKNALSHVIENTGQITTGISFAGSNDTLYVTNMGDNEIGIIDLKARKLINSFPSGGESPVNLTSDGQRLFVTNQKSGTLTVLTKEGKLLKSIATGAGALGIAFDATNNRLYSANRMTGTTTIIDAGTYKVLADLPTGSHPNHVKIDPQTGAVYVLNKTKGGKPVNGEPIATDPNGDTVTKISL